MNENPFEQWAIVELLGHVRLAGAVTEEELFGGKVGRIDIPLSDGKTMTQYFGHGSIYRLTPVSEELARSVAVNNQPKPILQYELPDEPRVPKRALDLFQAETNEDYFGEAQGHDDSFARDIEEDYE